jgi:hypothetical protein
MDYSGDQGNYGYDNDFDQDDQGPEVDLLKTKYKEGTHRVYHDFFKTKMCNLHLLNICKKGKECPFAHSEDELREKPNLVKTKLCQDFLEVGQCQRGDRCSFAHGETELRSTPDLFKTAICNLWTQGKCNAGERCRFAHGHEDLRPAPSHHKFKKNTFNKTFSNNQPQNKIPQQNQNFNQFYPSQQFQPNYGYHPMMQMPSMGMAPAYQDPNMMGGFMNMDNRGGQYSQFNQYSQFQNQKQYK